MRPITNLKSSFPRTLRFAEIITGLSFSGIFCTYETVAKRGEEGSYLLRSCLVFGFSVFMNTVRSPTKWRWLCSQKDKTQNRLKSHCVGIGSSSWLAGITSTCWREQALSLNGKLFDLPSQNHSDDKWCNYQSFFCTMQAALCYLASTSFTWRAFLRGVTWMHTLKSEATLLTCWQVHISELHCGVNTYRSLEMRINWQNDIKLRAIILQWMQVVWFLSVLCHMRSLTV